MSYIIYRFMYIFYFKRKVTKKVEVFSYIGYFIIITIIHTMIKIPIIVTVANIILLFLLTLLYVGNLKKSIMSVLLIYISLTCVETFVALLTSFIRLDMLSPFQYNSTFGVVVMRVISFALVLVIDNFKHLKKDHAIPTIYWVSLFAVPLGTSILLFTIFLGKGIPIYLIGISIFAVFLINLITFYLYDVISKGMEDKMNQRLLEQQNKYYVNQLEMVKATLHNTKLLRHDLKNKLSPIYELAAHGKNEELLQRLSELTNIYAGGKEYAHSGNTAIDSIINYKLNEAEKDNIEISCDIMIPSDLKVSSFDMAVILGNLIDNAIEAVRKVENNRQIEIRIKYFKGLVLITTENSYDGTVIEKDGLILSRKEDTRNHGLGLKSIQATVEKNGGITKIEHTDSKFIVNILMYAN